METLLRFDAGILFWIQEHLTAQWLQETLLAFTFLGNHGFLWILLGAILLCIPRERKTGAAVLMVLLASYLVGNLLLKNIVMRPRPFVEFPQVSLLLPAPSGYSFPSGHALSSFAAAAAVFRYHKKWGTAALFIAAFIAFSRLALFVHYPTDVLAGALLGVSLSWLLLGRKSPLADRIGKNSGHSSASK